MLKRRYTPFKCRNLVSELACGSNILNLWLKLQKLFRKCWKNTICYGKPCGKPCVMCAANFTIDSIWMCNLHPNVQRRPWSSGKLVGLLIRRSWVRIPLGISSFLFSPFKYILSNEKHVFCESLIFHFLRPTLSRNYHRCTHTKSY